MVSGLIVTTVLLSTVNLCLCQEDTVTVKIDQGELRGKVDNTINGFKYYSFQGIPYAKPPVGSLRFKLPDNETTELKPVMVSIHGGGFTMGFGSLSWNGPYFFVEEDVVFVSLNYRLGALGFLSTGDSVIPGNNGLKDQTLALRWVQQNIAKFGGNPDNVTIFGLSAGGCSVHHLVLSPLTKGKHNYDMLQERSKKRTINNNQLIPPNYFELTAERDVEEGEAVFLNDAPINTIRSGNFNQVPFISGTVTHEGSLMFDGKEHSYYKHILGTDFIILAGVDRHVSLHAEVSKAPVYQYLFSFNGRWGMGKSSRGDSFPAVGHGDDMDYFYYNSGLQYDFNSMEYTTLKRIVKMWTNFAKTGNPTPVSNPLLQNVTWSPVTALDNFYLEIGNDLIVKRNLENDRMSFWKNIYTRVLGP
ncbi:hypothetical protein C0J52_16131 [Blattella germanica]|nr:hypothetical protein C0J52_16131 [Blattella germanica]